jgi:DNA-binding NarL/FixJ family response regulator
MRVFHLEMNLADAELIRCELLQTQPDLEWVVLQDRAAFMAELDRELPALVLADHAVTHLGGLEALDLLRIRSLYVPFIVVANSPGEALVIDTLMSGATDYVLKSRLQRLGPAVQRALIETRVRQHQELAERTLESQQRLLRVLLDSIPDAIYAVDESERLVMANPALLRQAAACVGEPPPRPCYVSPTAAMSPAWCLSVVTSLTRKNWSANCWTLAAAHK